MSVPVMVLTGLGVLIALLGLFTGGGIGLLALGLGSVALAAIVQAISGRRG